MCCWWAEGRLRPDLLLPHALSCACPAGQWVGPAQPRFLAMAKEYGVGIYEAPQVGTLSIHPSVMFSPSVLHCGDVCRSLAVAQG